MASALNHAGIVAVYDVGRHEERPYVVMELIEGRPMTALLAESRLPLREVIDLAAQIAGAIHVAHATAPERGNDLVGADNLSGLGSHC